MLPRNPNTFNWQYGQSFQFNKYDISTIKTQTSEILNKVNISFNYETLNKLLTDEGINALLEELKKLKDAGIIESIEVTANENGATTISCEFNGTTYVFQGTKDDVAVNDTPANKPTNNPVQSTNIKFNSQKEFITYMQHTVLSKTGVDIQSPVAQTIMSKVEAFANRYLGLTMGYLPQDGFTQEILDNLVTQCVNELNLSNQSSDSIKDYLSSKETKEIVCQNIGIKDIQTLTNLYGINYDAFVNGIVAKHNNDGISKNAALQELINNIQNFKLDGMNEDDKKSALETYAKGGQCKNAVCRKVLKTSASKVDDSLYLQWVAKADFTYCNTKEDIKNAVIASYRTLDPNYMFSDFNALQTWFTENKGGTNSSKEYVYTKLGIGSEKEFTAKTYLSWKELTTDFINRYKTQFESIPGAFTKESITSDFATYCKQFAEALEKNQVPQTDSKLGAIAYAKTKNCKDAVLASLKNIDDVTVDEEAFNKAYNNHKDNIYNNQSLKGNMKAEEVIAAMVNIIQNTPGVLNNINIESSDNKIDDLDDDTKLLNGSDAYKYATGEECKSAVYATLNIKNDEDFKEKSNTTFNAIAEKALGDVMAANRGEGASKAQLREQIISIFKELATQIADAAAALASISDTTMLNSSQAHEYAVSKECKSAVYSALKIKDDDDFNTKSNTTFNALAESALVEVMAANRGQGATKAQIRERIIAKFNEVLANVPENKTDTDKPPKAADVFSTAITSLASNTSWMQDIIKLGTAYYQQPVNKYLPGHQNELKTFIVSLVTNKLKNTNENLYSMNAAKINELTRQTCDAHFNALSGSNDIYVQDFVKNILKDLANIIKSADLQDPIQVNISYDKNTNIAESAKGINNLLKSGIYLSDNTISTLSRSPYNTVKPFYSVSSNGTFTVEDPNSQIIYSNILSEIYDKIPQGPYAGLVTQLGNGDAAAGKNILKQLINAAWAMSDTSTDKNSQFTTKDFITTLKNNLEKLLSNIAEKPELLEIYTTSATTATPTMTYGTYNTNGDLYKDYDGNIHLDNTEADKKFQATMSDVLANLKTKYAHIDNNKITTWFREAQENYLKANKNKAISNIAVTNGILKEFDKILFKNMSTSYYVESKSTDQTQAWNTPARNTSNDTNIKDGISVIRNKISSHLTDSEINMFANQNGYSKMNTEFGIDGKGNIVFTDDKTTKAYQFLIDNLITDALDREGMSAALEKLGGKDKGIEILKKLILAAWITTYNDFESSQENNTKDFLFKVRDNYEKLLDKIIADPSKLEILTQPTNYGTRFENGAFAGYKNGNERANNQDANVIKYGGNFDGHPYITYDDGTVHIDNTNEDMQYQNTMNGVLDYLKNKYSSIDPNKITTWFREAQKKALDNCAQGKKVHDCPYGTEKGACVNGVDAPWAHSGSDSRSGDGDQIFVSQLVQLTLYYFDKTLYANL